MDMRVLKDIGDQWCILRVFAQVEQIKVRVHEWL